MRRIVGVALLVALATCARADVARESLTTEAIWGPSAPLSGGTDVGSSALLAPPSLASSSRSPASLVGLLERQAYFGHEFGLGDASFDVVGFGIPVRGGSALGGNLAVGVQRAFAETDGSGAVVRRWTASDYVLTATYSRRAQSWLGTGVNAKAFGADVFGTRWMGVAVDAGVQARLPAGIRAGAALLNAGWQASSSGRSAPVPPEVTAGIGASRTVGIAGIACQVEVRRAASGLDSGHLVVRGEMSVTQALTLRATWRPGAAAGSLSGGLAVQARSAGFEYGFLPAGAAGSVHRVGLTLRFSAARS